MSTPEPAVVAAGRSIVAAAAGRSVAVRLLGGVAIWLRGSAAARAALGRDYPDVDLVAHQRQSRPLRVLLTELGYQPERIFNAAHGARRLLYHSPRGWHVDVFLVSPGPDRERIRGRIGTVTAAMAAAPKTLGWQLRAKVGRRVRWYQRTRGGDSLT